MVKRWEFRMFFLDLFLNYRILSILGNYDTNRGLWMIDTILIKRDNHGPLKESWPTERIMQYRMKESRPYKRESWLTDVSKSGSAIYTVKSLAPICSSTTTTTFSEPCFRQSHTARHTQIKKKDFPVGFLGTHCLLLH